MAEGYTQRDFIGVIHNYSGTTDERGFLLLSNAIGEDIPIVPVLGSKIVIFFNGSSTFYWPYGLFLDVDGTPLKNTAVEGQIYCMKR